MGVTVMWGTGQVVQGFMDVKKKKSKRGNKINLYALIIRIYK
jgi:hypothetical protein